MDDQTPDMAERLRTQIARMVAGNGLPPEAVLLTHQHTTQVKLAGQLDVRLITRVENIQGKGPAPVKWHQQFEAAADIGPALAPLQSQLATDPQRLQIAADQILMKEHQGWGLIASDIPIPQLNYVAGAQYSCANCDGTSMQTCGVCNGDRRQNCPHCHGKREITCPTCAGRGVMSSGENCAACRQRGIVACATCQGQGEMSCTHCAGKGQTPCKGCDAKGTLYQQVTFNAFAQANFKLMLTENMPEDVMRHLRKLKPENLLGGRGTIIKDSTENGQDFVRINYHAEFPITQYQFQIGDMKMEFVTLGHKGTLFESPNFMDRILSSSLDMLRRARRREVPTAAALQELGRIKFYRTAFAPGPKNIHLRRRYPFGISAAIFREVPAGLHYLLSILTERPRTLAAVAFNAVATIVLLFTYALGTGNHLFGVMDVVFWIVLLLLNAGAILATHYVISAQALKPFGIRPNMQMDHMMTALGRTGLASLGITLVLCIVIRLIG